MASRGQSLTLTYVAWDTVNSVGKTGDVANHTLRWVKDGTSSAPANAASEVDATNAPGVYKITLTGGECTCDVGTLAGKSSTSGVSILPVTVTFEKGDWSTPSVAQTVDGTSTLTEAYPAVGGNMTLAQALYEIAQNLVEFGIAGTTLTARKRDRTTAAETYTLDSAVTPTTRTRTT